MQGIAVFKLASHGWYKRSTLPGNGNRGNFCRNGQVLHHAPNQVWWHFNVDQAHFPAAEAHHRVKLCRGDQLTDALSTPGVEEMVSMPRRR